MRYQVLKGRWSFFFLSFVGWVAWLKDNKSQTDRWMDGTNTDKQTDRARGGEEQGRGERGIYMRREKLQKQASEHRSQICEDSFKIQEEELEGRNG